MHVEWLSDFLSLPNSRNFSTAAHTRNITQPAFSRRIQSLEHWVGVPLIDQSGYPVTRHRLAHCFSPQPKKLFACSTAPRTNAG